MGQMLTIGNRKGQFPGMIENRTFHVVFVRENHGVGVDATDEPDKVVRFSGKEITVKP
jgi:alpha-D-xyloside xylohydrolase